MKLCDFNTAKALQELGYDGEYSHFHVSTDCGYQIMTLDDCEKHRGEIIRLCAAPRLHVVAYWLRVKHKIGIEPMYLSMAQEWRFAAYNMAYEGVAQLFVVYDKDYDSALEAAVKKTIEIIKNRKQNHGC